MSHDVIVVGAGPGGYVAAIRAAQLGAKVALIEKSQVGGTCLNTGCIPTKVMAASAGRLETVKAAALMGITGVGSPAIDYSVIHQKKSKLVQGLRGNIQQLLKGNGVELIAGEARFTAPLEITVGEASYTAKSVIIATGSTWKTLPSLPMDGQRVVSSDEVLAWETLPSSVILIGGGVIGCEFASILSIFGVKVTIVEAAASLLPNEDLQMSRTLQRALSKRSVDVEVGTTVTACDVGASSVTCTLSNGKSITADYGVVAIGRAPNTHGFGLEELGILDDRGNVIVTPKMETSHQGLYAIGDVTGKMMLAHVASQEAVLVAENIVTGTAHEMSYRAVPRPIFTHPEICAVGLTEQALQQQGVQYHVGKYAYAAIAKAHCEGETEGMLLVYTDADHHIVGAHMIGAHATDLLAPLVTAVQDRTTVSEFSKTIFAHPTLSEIVKEAVEDSEGRAIHKVYPKR